MSESHDNSEPGVTLSGVPQICRLVGVSLHNVSNDEAVAFVLTRLAQRTLSTVCFVNAHCANVAARDSEYRAVLDGADRVFADGIGMRLAGRWLSQPLRENVNGTDLFPLLCDALEGSGHRLFLLGGFPGVAEAVRLRLAEEHPGLNVCGCRDGYFGNGEIEEVVASVRKSRADLLLVALGVPQQELWLASHLSGTGAIVGMGVGGLFDFYSGRVRRAPAWMRALSLEWLFRLAMEPRRLWRRYLLGNVRFLSRVIHDRFRPRTPSR